jgi:hypothetical protein
MKKIITCGNCHSFVNVNSDKKCVCGQDFTEQYQEQQVLSIQNAFLGKLRLESGKEYGKAFDIDLLTNEQIKYIRLQPEYKQLWNQAKFMTKESYKNLQLQTA